MWEYYNNKGKLFECVSQGLVYDFAFVSVHMCVCVYDIIIHKLAKYLSKTRKHVFDEVVATLHLSKIS